MKLCVDLSVGALDLLGALDLFLQVVARRFLGLPKTTRLARTVLSGLLLRDYTSASYQWTDDAHCQEAFIIADDGYGNCTRMPH